MDLALYGEHGFYASGGRAGRRGDFITSPEVGPLFGAVLARAIDAWWNELGRPSDFAVVEAGAGPGTLARAILAAASVGARRQRSALRGGGDLRRAAGISSRRRRVRRRHARRPDRRGRDRQRAPRQPAVPPRGPRRRLAGSVRAARRRSVRRGTAPARRPGPSPSCRPAGFRHGARAPLQAASRSVESLRARPIGAWAARRHRLCRRPYGGARPAPVARVAPHLSRPRPWRRTT